MRISETMMVVWGFCLVEGGGLQTIKNRLGSSSFNVTTGAVRPGM